jgi:hypothetical protein
MASPKGGLKETHAYGHFVVIGLNVTLLSAGIDLLHKEKKDWRILAGCVIQMQMKQ